MSVETNGRVRQLIGRLRDLLSASAGSGVELTIADDGYVQEGGWVYLIVTPAKPGVRAIEYVERLQALEEKLRQEFGAEVLLVPARPE